MPWYVNPLLAQAGQPEPTSNLWYLHLLVAVGTLAVSFFLGGYLGKKLRMPDHGWKIGVSLFTLLASAAILLMGPPLKYGVDLSGGVILIYEVDQSKKVSDQPVDMNKLIDAVARRVNPGGQKEVTIRKYGVEAVEIIIPQVEEAEVRRIEDLISTAGNLQFRILANTNSQTDTDIIERAKADPTKSKLVDASGNLLAWWVPVRPGQEASVAGRDAVTREREVGKRKVLEVLVIKDTYDVTGFYLTKAGGDNDEKGQPCVHFSFNSAGGDKFGELTGDHLPHPLTHTEYRLGIILDDELYSAPGLKERIYSSGRITGSFTLEEVQRLVDVLNAGSLPAALSKAPISELQSGPTLGRDTIEKGKNAMLISCLLVVAFMLWYYHFSGLVANIALVLNMMMLVAIMLTIKAAFTLTGFAGLALTVGMAVDNNVLVYERLREELERGATLRMAIRNAFHRAAATIIDCNLTHLIAASVLFMIGSDQLRGFAVTLWLGVAISMYTSIFVAHMLFDIAEKRQWITRLKMLRLIGHTNIDFMGMAPYCIGASVLITLMAIGVSIQRGQSLFDIDFTGGVSVQALFNEPQDTAEVRKLLSNKLPDLAVSDVRFAKEKEGLRFDVNTSQADLAKVKSVLSEVFRDKLARNSVTATAPKVIEGAAKTAPPAKDAPAKEPAEPAKKDQSRSDLPASNVLALADGDGRDQGSGARDQLSGSLLAMAAEDAAPAKSAPVEPAAALPAAKESSPEAPPAAQSVETPRSKAAPPTSQPPLGVKTPEGGDTEKPAAPAPFAGGWESQLTFAQAVNHQAAEQLVTTAMESVKLDPQAVSFELTGPKGYVEGDMTAYKQWDLKVAPPAPQEKVEALVKTLEQQVAGSPIFPASNTIGGAVAGNTRLQAVYALVASWVCIIIYLWVRFQGVAFGLAAVVALVHDVFVMLGAVAISYYVAPYLGFLMIEPFKINLPIVAAFLTIVGYSVNDTIVVFDRIREVRGKDPRVTRKMVNDSTNQTLSRTLLTSLTVLLVVIVLYFFGGDAIHGFAFALVVGVLTGTYSSIYVAAPILLWLVGKHKEHAT